MICEPVLSGRKTVLAVAFVSAFVFIRPAQAVDVMAAAIIAPEGNAYGVATIEIPLAAPLIGKPPRPIRVNGDPGRVLFPAAADVVVPLVPASQRPVPQPGNGRLLGRLGKLIKEITDGEDVPKSQIVARRVMFLFKGNAPFRVELSDSVGVIGTYELKPIEDSVSFRDSSSRWWNAFTEQAKRQIDDADYPTSVESYLVAMLSGRTGNRLPQWYLESDEEKDPLLATIEVLAGARGMLDEMFRLTAAGLDEQRRPLGSESDTRRLALPQPPNWREASLPEIDPDVDIEPIATRIPPECFYIRFGSFSNYLWFRDLSQEYGGDVGRMVTLHGTEAKTTERFEQQLSLKINQLTRMLGSSVIEDQAVIGRDLLTADGASMGVLMKSTNAFLLRTSLGNDRATRAREDDSVSLKTVKVSGKDVSFLSTADNRVRSFLAEDDGYFFITNSKTLVERFFEVGATKQSLATSKPFRLSRMLVPTSRGDTIFAYFSPEMLQGLVAPSYMIELHRRAAAKGDLTLVHLARLAASLEGGLSEASHDAPQSIDSLIEEGFLPVSFGARPDGSGVFALGDDVLDTRRGARGTFLPIADIEIDSVTPAEYDWYEQIANSYSGRFPQMDPIILALKREEIPRSPDLERIKVHAEIAPLTPEKYGKWAKQLGPPTRVAMRFAPDDIVALQAHVASEQLGPATHLFAGIKDSYPPAPEDFDGLIGIYRSLRQLPGYLGAWPQPGALDRLPLGLGRGRPIGPGMSKLIGGLYRYTGGGFSILSFQQDVLTATLPYLEAAEVDEAATVRGRVGSLLGSKLEGWVNNQLYQRAAQSSVAGAEFLNLLEEQLRVPPEESLKIAKQILGDGLQCSLGGTYQYSPRNQRWISTAWVGGSPLEVPPDNYIAPLLAWFRGMEVTMTQYSDRVVADLEVVIARNP
ncbi:MAG: hypothetical protein AAF802_03095 [Planctomycetota bacterium]